MKLLLLVCFCCLLQQQILAQSNLVRSTTGASGTSEEIAHGGSIYIIQQTVGQPSVIGTVSHDNYTFRQGFIQPDVFSKIVEKDMPLDLQLVIYPNPFDNQITLAFTEDIKNDIHISVFNILGARVFSKSYKSNQQIDVVLDWLSSGEYILKTVANQKQFIAKILKK